MPTESETIAELTRQGTGPNIEPLDEDGRLYSVAVPRGWAHELIDLGELLNEEPRRARATVAVHDAPSFVAAVRQRVEDETRAAVYADETKAALVCVLNDDTGTSGPAWRDHRVSLDLRKTPEWVHWLKLDGSLVDQETFASHIEDGLAELGDAAADMLELAQTIQGMTQTRWKGGHRVASGARQFTYEEDTDAQAGANGQLAIPEKFDITLRPFIGSDRVTTTARFRFRLPRGGGEVKLGYKLDRPHDVERTAFVSVVEQVAAELPSLALLRGTAPAPTSADMSRVVTPTLRGAE